MRRTLHLGLLVAALAGCGKEEDTPENLCKEQDGVGCSEGRTCEYDPNMDLFRCVGKYTGGNGGSGGNSGAGGVNGSIPSNSRCGNSPLNGNYLWQVGSCEIGTTVAADQEKCSFLLEGDIAGGEGIRSSYEENRITLGRYGTFELVRSIASSDLAPDNPSLDCSYDSLLPDGVSIEQFREKYNCALREGSLYSLKGGNGVCLLDNLWRISDSPWPGRDHCRELVRDEEWTKKCF